MTSCWRTFKQQYRQQTTSLYFLCCTTAVFLLLLGMPVRDNHNGANQSELSFFEQRIVRF